MQNNVRSLLAFSLMLLTLFTACNKEDAPQQEDAASSESRIHAEDQNQVSATLDAVSLDLNVALESNASFGGRVMGGDTICGATIRFDTTANSKRITITYSGNDCQGTVLRTGLVTVTMPSGVRWKDAGAVLTVTYDNFKVVRLRDNKSVILSGTYLLTNVSGGLLLQLPDLNTITHAVTGTDLTIRFNDSAMRSWNVARQSVYSYNNGLPFVSITGTHTDGAQTRIAEWGKNRFGKSFVTVIVEPIVISSACNFRITSGQVQHKSAAGTATVVFGLDKNGVATSCPGSGNYFYQLVWTAPDSSYKTFMVPY
jgi:hypothetical protein